METCPTCKQTHTPIWCETHPDCPKCPACGYCDVCAAKEDAMTTEVSTDDDYPGGGRLRVRICDLQKLDVIALTSVTFPRTVIDSRVVSEDSMVIVMDSGWPGPWFSDRSESTIYLIGGPRFDDLRAGALPCWRCSELYAPDPDDPFPRFCPGCVLREATPTPTETCPPCAVANEAGAYITAGLAAAGQQGGATHEGIRQGNDCECGCTSTDS